MRLHVIALIGLSLCFLFAYQEGYAKKRNKKAKATPIETVEEPELNMPTFQGQEPNAFMQWVAPRVQYPKQAEENQVQGTVVIRFAVEEDGTLSDFEIIRSADPLLDEEALRVVKLSPPWEPALENGEPTRMHMVIPIIFRLE